MRLLNINTLRLEDRDELKRKRIEAKDQQRTSVASLNDILKNIEVPYAIVSHVWLDPGLDYQNEVLLDDLKTWNETKTRKPRGVAKIIGACQAARQWSQDRQRRQPGSAVVEHIWLDSCCIDQKNQAELSMSINSMYRWYQQATVCLVFLSDVKRSSTRSPDLSTCKWFTRGWTLQELVASTHAEFYDSDWAYLGSKLELQTHLAEITNIEVDILSRAKKAGAVSIAQRMSWAARRVTRVEEDRAYCLMGLFGVQMPTMYGEGSESAFRRLQEEIIRNDDDHSIFAWMDPNASVANSGLLASSPALFLRTGMYRHLQSQGNTQPYAMTNKGLSIDLYLQKHPTLDKYIASLDCPIDQDHYLGIFLKCVSERAKRYARIDVDKFCRVRANGRGALTSIYVKEANEDAENGYLSPDLGVRSIQPHWQSSETLVENR